MLSKLLASDDTDSEGEVSDFAHETLLKSLGVDKDKKEETSKQRTESVQEVSVFSLGQKSYDDTHAGKVHLHQLINSLEGKSNINILKKQINRVKRPTQHLNAPLSKPVAERLQRKVEYEKASTTVSHWDGTVQKNRKADHLSFPLNQKPLQIKTVDEFLFHKSKKLTPLEEEIQALMNGNKCLERKDHDLSVLEEEALTTLSLEEARARRAELQKHRALLSYHEAKNRRQNKIKSKKYHRMMRKRKMKEDSPKALDIKLADQQRAEERASLRHRAGSKWEKGRKLIAKHDEKTKFELDAQKQKHEELMVRPEPMGSVDLSAETPTIPATFGNDGDAFDHAVLKLPVENNPWLSCTSETTKNDSKLDNTSVTAKCDSGDELLCDNAAKSSSLMTWLSQEENNSVESMKTVVPAIDSEAVKKFKEAFSKIKSSGDGEDGSYDFIQERAENSEHEANSESLKFKTLDKGDHKFPNLNTGDSPEEISCTNLKTKSNSTGSTLFKPEIENISTSSDLKFVHDDNNSLGDEQRMTIEQAFADDDVLAEFSFEKNELIEGSKPKDIDLSLPGWGEWGGTGVVPSKRKKRKFLTKAKPPPPRKDVNLDHVIITEDRDIQIAKHQVHDIPFPFVNSDHFEKTIVRPVGSTWNTPSAVKSLTNPEVSTLLGAIISPMDSESKEPNKTKNKNNFKKQKVGAHTSRSSRKQNRLQKLKILGID
ncbi:unnamed protein product [Clavelina lepadiformis]|uniref:U3 small nucleolar RNA-associated protein 14 n=1 Tax=Clavelina lepadiformis TaxID=159417 RepID=A0ABP0F678_CLALP